MFPPYRNRTVLIISSITLIALLGIAFLVFTHTKQTESVLDAARTVDADTGEKQYTHPSYLFSFVVPEEVQIESHYEPGGAETVVFTEPARDFQLYIVPYSKDTITSSQIQKDTHGRAVTTPVEVVLGSGIRGIIFETEDPELGRLREVWFLMNGHLYEATTHINNEAWLAGILDTLVPNRP